MSKLIRGNEAAIWQNWNSATAAMHLPQRGDATDWMYIGPNGSRWDLEGRQRGRQGVRFGPVMVGATHLSFEHLFTETAYQVGASYERSNILRREINVQAIIGSPKYSAHAYRMIESNWWDAWPHDTPGWLGCHTRFGGWRWASVMLAEPIRSPVKQDPTAHKNNMQTWDFKIVAPKPWFAKPMLYTTWKAHPETVAAHGFDQETIAIANRGQFWDWPLFVVSAPGKAMVQDGMTDRMVPLPTLTSDDGYMLVDTDPANRTLTGSTDPVDNVFYDLARSSRILDFFLHDIDALGLPVWRRGNGIRFLSQVPPRTVANIRVQHDNPSGSITVMMPQRFMRSS